MSDPKASDFTDASTAMLEAATGAARGFLMSIGIVLDDGTCAALACVVTQAAILAQVESDKDMPEEAATLAR